MGLSKTPYHVIAPPVMYRTLFDQDNVDVDENWVIAVVDGSVIDPPRSSKNLIRWIVNSDLSDGFMVPRRASEGRSSGYSWGQ